MRYAPLLIALLLPACRPDADGAPGELSPPSEGQVQGAYRYDRQPCFAPAWGGVFEAWMGPFAAGNQNWLRFRMLHGAHVDAPPYGGAYMYGLTAEWYPYKEAYSTGTGACYGRMPAPMDPDAQPWTSDGSHLDYPFSGPSCWNGSNCYWLYSFWLFDWWYSGYDTTPYLILYAHRVVNDGHGGITDGPPRHWITRDGIFWAEF